MAEFLSAEWVAALNALLRAGGVKTDGGPPLVIQQIVEHPAGRRSTYEIRVDADGAEATGDCSGDATVVYRQSDEVARGIASGALDAHVEFLMGRVVVSGDTKALADHRATLDRLAGALADMGETTDF
ncbi:MAG: hypothetical protein OXH20_04270 [bacterium]|nr:hypothetical protein [bacterium]MDE0669607.1 hypothetical protein [bacterium]MYB25492.1 hypothetical protein [Acidimicrobiia bacterium]